MKDSSQQHELPFVVDMLGGVYFRPQRRSGQVLCGTIREEDEREVVPEGDLDSFCRSVDPEVREFLRHGLEHRLGGAQGVLAQGRAGVKQVCGLYTINREDFHPVIGPAEGCEGYYVCNGFSGHGFKIAPAVGSMLAAMIAGKRAGSTSDASAFDTTVDPMFFHPHRKPIHLPTKGVLA